MGVRRRASATLDVEPSPAQRTAPRGERSHSKAGGCFMWPQDAVSLDAGSW